MYQKLRIALSEVESNIASLKVRVNQYQAKVNTLKGLINTIPQVEAEFAQLNRDYAINKSNYETLISRRESAKISDKAEKSADTIKFQVIESPVVPLQPVGPNRLLLSSAVLVGGVAIGCIFAFFLAQLKPTFHGRKAVIDILGINYLGSVTMVRTSKQKLVRRLEIISFGVVFIGLIAVYASYILITRFIANPV